MRGGGLKKRKGGGREEERRGGGHLEEKIESKEGLHAPAEARGGLLAGCLPRHQVSFAGVVWAQILTHHIGVWPKILPHQSGVLAWDTGP